MTGSLRLFIRVPLSSGMSLLACKGQWRPLWRHTNQYCGSLRFSNRFDVLWLCEETQVYGLWGKRCHFTLVLQIAKTIKRMDNNNPWLLTIQNFVWSPVKFQSQKWILFCLKKNTHASVTYQGSLSLGFSILFCPRWRAKWGASSRAVNRYIKAFCSKSQRGKKPL